MRNAMLLLALAICLGAVSASGETPMEKSRRISEAKGDNAREAYWWDGMIYREWIRDMNSLSDDNGNLDENIYFVADGKVRAHPEKIYFYNDIDLAIQISAGTKMPLAFYVMDESCEDCLYLMTEVFMDPVIVEKSRGFVNVYVRFPYFKNRVSELRMMTSAPTVQFLLPGLRRLRALTRPGVENLSETYDLINKHIAGLTPEQMMERPTYR